MATPARMATTVKSNQQSHLFWAEAALSYTLPKSQQNFYTRLTAGTSVDADRFSAYRLGGFLPLVSEFPCRCPVIIIRKSARGILCCSTPVTSCRSTRSSTGT